MPIATENNIAGGRGWPPLRSTGNEGYGLAIRTRLANNAAFARRFVSGDAFHQMIQGVRVVAETGVVAEERAWPDPRLKQLLAGLTAVRDGDFGTRLPQVGDELTDEIARVFNGMVDQLARFTSEVTRVAREVGTDGKLGGQAEVTGVSGSWKDLTDSVNAMAGNLTDQVRDIAQVATAVARGDLSQNIRVDARGEILELKETINRMVDQLSAFAAEATLSLIHI